MTHVEIRLSEQELDLLRSLLAFGDVPALKSRFDRAELYSFVELKRKTSLAERKVKRLKEPQQRRK